MEFLNLYDLFLSENLNTLPNKVLNQFNISTSLKQYL